MPGSNTFSEDLWDKFDVVVKKIRNGKNFSGTAAKFLKEKSKIERDFAKALAKLCKDKAFNGELEYGSVKTAWSSYIQETEQTALKYEALAEETNVIVENMQLYLTEAKKTRKQLVANGEKCTKELRASEKKVADAKSNYEKLKKKQEEVEDEANKVSGTAKEPKARKEAEACGKRSEKGDSEYRDAIKQLQVSHQKFYFDEMPKILDDLQRFEEDRMDKMKEWYLKIVSTQEQLPPFISSSNETIKTSAEAVDRPADIVKFVGENTSGAVKPECAQFEPYITSNSDLSRTSSTRITTLTSASSIGNMGSVKATSSPYNAPSAATTTAGTQSKASSVGSGLNAGAAAAAAPAEAPKTVVKALYDYTATESTEISFKANDRITVLHKDDSGWWQGDLNGRIGMFPSNFVDPTPISNTSGSGSTISLAKVSTPVASAPAPSPAVGKPDSKCKVLYDYNADSDSELTIKEGETLTIESEDEGWFFGFNSTGQSGRFPSNYVKTL